MPMRLIFYNGKLVLMMFFVLSTMGFNQSKFDGKDADAMNAKFNGALRNNPSNPSYFTDNRGKAVYLTGSHTWAVFQEISSDPNTTDYFDYNAYLDMMEKHNHNFLRFWYFEQPSKACWSDGPTYFDPLPYQRSGSGMARDGLSKFDLEKWNEDFFIRLRARLIEAGNKGIYVSVMLFQGFSLNIHQNPKSDPWITNPYNPKNNIKGIGAADSIPDDDVHSTVHSLKNTELLKVQEKYVAKIIETVNDLDNVLFEIINEGGATDWQYHMIDFIHNYEKKMPKQHAVGMTARISSDFHNFMLYESKADWVSPRNTAMENYRENPPANKYNKVIVPDTDHLWGHGGNYKWVWKSFTRGLNPIFMDAWGPLGFKTEQFPKMLLQGDIWKDTRDYPDWEPIRQNLGYTKVYADKIDLTNMFPHGELTTTGYCLANLGKEYLVYFPEGGNAVLDLTRAPGEYSVEWFFPLLNRTLTGKQYLKGGKFEDFTSPYTGDAVLYLKIKE